MKKTICSFLLWLLLLPAFAKEPQESLRDFLASKAIDPERTAVCIIDLESDWQMAAYRTTEPIIPASVMKCVTTEALASVYPYSTTLNTKVLLEGTIDDGVFYGKLTVVGSGDPSLGDGRHKEQPDFLRQITETLKKKGISTFAGEIAVDNSLFKGTTRPASWMASDLDQAYGTGLHAFNFEGNASGKKAVADPASIFKSRLARTFADSGLAPVQSTSSDSQPEGETPAGNGKKVKGVLLDYASPPLETLMRSCMFRSDNLYAESFLRLFGLQNGADGIADLSAVMAMQYWDALNFPMDGIEIIDGSGLSRENRLTAEFLAAVLRAGSPDAGYVSFFPLAGEEGTVRNFMADTPLQGRLALKTGSMKGIQSYAGYVLDDRQMPSHVVVVMTDGLKNRAEFRSALTRMLLDLFAQDTPN